VPANAAAPAFVLDPSYGGLNGAPRGVATAGLPAASGVDAKTLGSYRYVLSQTRSGTPAAYLSRFDSAGRPDNSYGTTGKLSLTALPTGATVSKLVTDGTSLYVVAQSGLNLYITKYDNTGTAVTTGWGTSGLATISTSLAGGSTFSVVDVKSQTITGSTGLVIALNGQATGAPTTGAWIVRVSSAGVLDTSFNTGGTVPGVWPVTATVGGTLYTATSMGGIGIRASTDGTNPNYILASATLPAEANTSNDTQSTVVSVNYTGAIGTAATNAIETYTDNAGWSFEQLGDIGFAGTAATETPLVVGRTTSGYFVARQMLLRPRSS
jgi:hypothetical protein